MIDMLYFSSDVLSSLSLLPPKGRKEEGRHKRRKAQKRMKEERETELCRGRRKTYIGKRKVEGGLDVGVSNPWPRMAKNEAKHKIVNLLKIL